MPDLSLLYRNNPLGLLGKIEEKQSSYPYEVDFMTADAENEIVAFRATQKIQATNYYSPKVEAAQSVSSSAFFHTACRYFDRMDGRIEAYEAAKTEEFRSTSPRFYSYDAFLQKNGKLFSRTYYVLKEIPVRQELVRESFLTRDRAVYDATQDPRKRVVHSLLMYQVNDALILRSSVNRNPDGTYLLFLDLDARFCNDYYATQMAHQGVLFDAPKFSLSQVTLTLQEDFTPVSLVQKDAYTAKTGLFNVQIEMTTRKEFHFSEDGVFLLDGKRKNVLLPGKEDLDFVFADVKEE